MKFLLCSCDEETFEMVIGTSPVVGTNERFVVPMEVYFDDFEAIYDVYVYEMAELGIELLFIV